MQDKDQLILALLANDNFVQWVTSPDHLSDQHWQQWMQQSFERKEIVEEARKIVLALDFETTALSDHQRILLKKRIQQSVGSKDVRTGTSLVPQGRPSLPSQSILLRPLKYAAVVALLILAGYLFLVMEFTENQKIMQATAYGETSSLSLPDGSSVILNANSSLEYWSDWDGHTTREVWLQGEAFFNVEQITKPVNDVQEDPQKVKFVVHTDNLDIEVVGTEFNVRSRRGDTEVTLNSGQVKLNSKQLPAVSNIIMKPGDHAQLSARNDFDIKTVDPDTYSSWKQNILNFDGIPLQEIARKIEDDFGYQITMDEELMRKKVTITLLNGDIKKFCKMLEEMDLGIAASLDENNNKIILEMK